MSLDRYTSEISRYLIRFAQAIEISNSMNRNTDAVDAENLFRDLLNLVFGWDLKNANEKSLNQGYFDLEDLRKKICVQVTSNQQRKKKIESAITGFRDKQLYKKFNTLVILFIVYRCNKVYLNKKRYKNYTYEGYDLAKLVRYIYYHKTHDEKKELHSFLKNYDEHSPHFEAPRRIKPINTTLLKNQVPPVGGTTFYIKRPKLIEQVFSFCQEANGLLTGGPGEGKSFVIEEVHRYLSSKKAVCCIIRINELLKGTDEEIGFELKLGPQWLERLATIPQNNPKVKNVLVFDAFDTAKNESLKSEILWQIKKSIEKLKDGWRVVASCRTYDAQKSDKFKKFIPWKKST